MNELGYEYGDVDEYEWLHPHVDFHETGQAHALAALLMDRLHPRSVLDVGCSTGIYLVGFREAGCEVYGVDASLGAGGHLALSEYELVDLRNPWTPHHRFDLALCIEVAEHLRPIHAPTLVGTLARCADLIYFSAARPHQNGSGHHNEQTQDYWLKLFSQYGMARHPASADIQSVIDREEPYAHCKWLRWNGMLIGR